MTKYSCKKVKKNQKCCYLEKGIPGTFWVFSVLFSLPFLTYDE